MIIKKVMPKIPVAKKRVAAYCRVSTFRNEQDESFETQQKYYEELIQSHPDWELVEVYADRHSATRVKNRPGFQEMVAAAEAKKMDIIICKSISRFSRNMVDCQQYAKWFRTLGVTIIFEEQNIRTDDPTCDFVLSILAAVAQDESHLFCVVHFGFQIIAHSYAGRHISLACFGNGIVFFLVHIGKLFLNFLDSFCLVHSVNMHCDDVVKRKLR